MSIHAHIDGNGFFARCFFAAKGDESIDPDEGFIDIGCKFLQNIVRELRPTHWVWAFDGKAKTDKGRPDKDPGYDPALASFIDFVKESFPGAFRMLDEYEADDVLACTVAVSSREGVKSVVVSSDKDLHQLVSDKVSVWCLHRKRRFNAYDVCEHWGVRKPRHVALALALMGDSGDGIPGVRGIGPKRARPLLEALDASSSFGDCADALAGSLGDKADEFWSSLELVLLHEEFSLDPPVPVSFAPISLHRGRDFYASYLSLVDLYDPSAFDSECESALAEL